ncbi:unnamed protein product, partial [Nippostrongylus brasiliensis]|uniref:Uncharacterized protein n=1 Tax=Nippostrongylus brasiliensis TaxID=27835 RepID=A0A0N4YZ40_NIPBR
MEGSSVFHFPHREKTSEQDLWSDVCRAPVDGEVNVVVKK